QHMAELLVESELVWTEAEAAAWRQRYGRHLDDVRGALAWAMSPEGDPLLGVALSVRSVLLLFQLSRSDESVRNLTAAMGALPGPGTIEPALEFQLYVAHAVLIIHTRGPVSHLQRSQTRASEIAQQQCDRDLLSLECAMGSTGEVVRDHPKVHDA